MPTITIDGSKITLPDGVVISRQADLEKAVKMFPGQLASIATSPEYIWDTEVMHPSGRKAVRLRFYGMVTGGTGYVQLISRYPTEKLLKEVSVTATTYHAVYDTGWISLAGDEDCFILKMYVTAGQTLYITNPLLMYL
jgi:hypothetical protein